MWPIPRLRALLLCALLVGCSKAPDAASRTEVPNPRGGSFAHAAPGAYEYRTPPAAQP